MITSMKGIKIPFSEFEFSFSRSGGSGGQNVNKVNTKVTMYWKIDESPSLGQAVKARFKEKFHYLIVENGQVLIIGQRFRSQKDNIDDCIEKLHQYLTEVATPPKIRKPTKPKRSAVKKRLESKRKSAETKSLRKKIF
jgi:ribosome-associated protein